jgi:hypothetical protein
MKIGTDASKVKRALGNCESFNASQEQLKKNVFIFQVLVELAQLQDEEVGDGTTSVVLVAAELLKNADEVTILIHFYRRFCELLVVSCRPFCTLKYQRLR